MLIAIDHGNSAIKTIHTNFTAGLTSYPVKPPFGDDVIQFNNEYWALTGNRMPYMRNKTKDIRYFILTLFAIAKETLETNSQTPEMNIDLAVGLPPEHYSAQKDEFATYFKENGRNAKFIYNDAAICINIRKVFVYPQAFAAVAPQSQVISAMPRVYIIDVGGYTVDILLLRNGKPDLQFCRSLEMGVITMNNEIIGKINAQHDIKIEDDHIADVLNNRETILPKTVQLDIREMAESYANNIIYKLRELQIDLKANPSIFMGGGSALFKPYIEGSPMVTKADFIPTINANAIGYDKMGSAQSKKST